MDIKWRWGRCYFIFGTRVALLWHVVLVSSNTVVADGNDDLASVGLELLSAYGPTVADGLSGCNVC